MNLSDIFSQKIKDHAKNIDDILAKRNLLVKDLHRVDKYYQLHTGLRRNTAEELLSQLRDVVKKHPELYHRDFFVIANYKLVSLSLNKKKKAFRVEVETAHRAYVYLVPLDLLDNIDEYISRRSCDVKELRLSDSREVSKEIARLTRQRDKLQEQIRELEGHYA